MPVHFGRLDQVCEVIGMTNLQVDKRNSSVGLGDACKDFFLYVMENLQWISSVNEGSSFRIVIFDPKVLR